MTNVTPTMSDPLRSFDINLLVAFDALMLTRSVTRAAEQMLVKRGNRMLATARAEKMHAGVRDWLARVRTPLQHAEPFRPRISNREFVIYTPEYFETLLLPGSSIDCAP
jgi:DNA-binding transcriptional LysR family regulator